jgi:hypothetical protein
MPRIKLEGLAQPFETIGQGLKSGQSAIRGGVLGGVKGVTAVATTGVGAATAGLNTGLTGVFSLGKGFRDFILRGTVVELAVAVVLGSAFTKLIESATAVSGGQSWTVGLAFAEPLLACPVLCDGSKMIGACTEG